MTEFDGDHPAERCSGCAVQYHTECLAEFGGCATAGCAERNRVPRAAEPEVPEVSQEQIAEWDRSLTVSERIAREAPRVPQYSRFQRTLRFLDRNVETGMMVGGVMMGLGVGGAKVTSLPQGLTVGLSLLGLVVLFSWLGYGFLRKVLKDFLDSS